MKQTLALCLLLSISACSSMKKTESKSETAQGLKVLWELNEQDGISNPESAYYDQASGSLFLSQVAGSPDGADGKGWIVKADASGKVIEKEWVKGLNAPKGMRSYKGVLWVSDLNRVVAIDIKSKRILHNIKINSAKFLNDIAIDNSGTVYISDTFANRIFTITNGNQVGLFSQGDQLEAPNGLLVQGNTLFLSTWGKGIGKDFSVKAPGNLYKIDLRTKKQTKITPKNLGNLDGLEMKESTFLISDWMNGKVFEVSAQGEAKEILSGFKGSADIGFIKEGSVLVVPRMMENKVTAYQL